jgi:hypothetical protein
MVGLGVGLTVAHVVIGGSLVGSGECDGDTLSIGFSSRLVEAASGDLSAEKPDFEYA